MRTRRRVGWLVGLMLAGVTLMLSGCGSSSTSSTPLDSQGLVTSAALTDTFTTSDAVAANKQNLKIIDVRSATAYAAGHIEGAINVPSSSFVYTRSDGVKYIIIPEAQFIALANSLGITNDSTVVVYADDTNSYAGRLVWSFNFYGFRKATTLDGGITKWINEGRPLVTAATVPTPTTGFTVTSHADILALASDVQAAIGKSNVVLLDTRAPAEYNGTLSLDLYRPGHLPAAVNINWLDLQKTDASGAQVLKSKAELLAQLYAKGITPDKQIIAYCEGGIRSGYVTTVLKGLGYPSVKNYDGSWNEWGKFAQNDPNAYPTVLETPAVGVGYVINTGGSGTALPGITLIDRASKTVTKTVRFTNQVGTRINHFANVTADGSELWACSGQGGAAGGSVNIYDTAAFKNFSTLNDSNKGSFIKKSFDVGCGVQNTQSPDGKYLFTSADQAPKGVNVFDVKNRAYLGKIPNSATAPHVGDISADGKKFYTTTAGLHTVVGYDISALPAIVPTDANKFLDLDLGYGNLHALRLHPNGKYLFVGNNTWPVPAGVTSTSGVNVIDLSQNPPRIIATIPGRPHNFAISLDGKYLLSTESAAPDCDITPGDPGSLVQFIDISTLLTATPDPTKIKDIYHFTTPGFGGSHAGWDAFTGLLYYSVSDTTGQGWLIKLDTSNLSAATPSVTQVGDKIKIGWAPHGVSFPGRNGD